MTKLSTVSVAIAAAVAALFCLSRLRQQPAAGNTGAVLDQFRQIHSDLKIQRRAIDDSRSVLNDAHKLIHTVSKGLAKQPS